MINNYDIAVMSEKIAQLEAAIKTAGIELPTVTADDNTTLLQVVAGKWAKGVKLPAITADDEGKALNVNSSGAWQVSKIGAENIPYDSTSSVKEKIPKIKELTFTNKSNSDTSAYYIALSTNLISDIDDNATEILGLMLTGWSAIQNIISIGVESNILYLLFPKGHTFTNASLKVTVLYR